MTTGYQESETETAAPDARSRRDGTHNGSADGNGTVVRRRLGGTPWTPVVPVIDTEASTDSTPAPRTERIKYRRRRRRRRPWYRRRRVVAPVLFLVFVASVVGWVGYRVDQTLSTMQSINRPPEVVSGSALGGDQSIQIDTSRALAYVEQQLPDAAQESDSGGLFAGFQDTASGVKGVVSGAAAAAGLSAPLDETTTILLMGVDARPGEPIDISTRPDALMVLHLNATRGTCRILSIPRDTRTELPGYGQSKVNHALVVGGIPYQKLVVANLLGLEIDRYALIDFAGFAAFVDAIGGVTINVPEAFTASDGTVFEAGPQRFDGQTALAYARYRGGPDRDLGRIRNQQQIIGALIREAAKRDIARDVNELLPALETHIRTDLAPDELVALAKDYRGSCTPESIPLLTLSGTVEDYEDPLLQQRIDYFVVAPAEVAQKVAELTAS